jgi:transketolase
MNHTKLDQKSIEYRKEILKIIRYARRGHIGSAFSCLEIIRVLYEDVLRVDPKNPFWEERDRFILSKGHGCLALYVVLAEVGFFPKDELYSFCKPDSILGGHPDYGKVPGVEISTGSLGHGLSIGVGFALNGKLDGKDYRTFVLLSDGECDEGSVWEAALCASKHRLNRLIAIIDYNKTQVYSTTSEVLELEPFADKWQSFGFDVYEVDGHDVVALREILGSMPSNNDKPHVIISHTVKGKGVPFLENNCFWHHQRGITDEKIDSFYKALEVQIEKDLAKVRL